MNRGPMVLSLLLLSACSSAGMRPAEIEAVRDFIVANELEGASRIRTRNSDGFTVLNDYFVIYNGRQAHYLVEFSHKCYEIGDPNRVTPDRRSDANNIYPRRDTIRGCMIKTIYPVNEAQNIELRGLGDAPGRETNR